jgi:hypothetical protein
MMDIRSNYASTRADWTRFLGCWRHVVSERLSKTRGWSGLSALPDDVNRVADAGTADIAGHEIERIQVRLGHRLPKSYLDFAVATGGRGWFVEAFGHVDTSGRPAGGLSSFAAIGPFKGIDAPTYGVWMGTAGSPRTVSPAEYYRYGYEADPKKRQDSANVDLRALEYMIKVGDLDQGAVVLVNPREITQDGEMEAWTLSFTSHVTRYRSFAELMQDLAYIDLALDSAKSALSTPNVYAGSRCIGLLRTAATAQ